VELSRFKNGEKSEENKDGNAKYVKISLERIIKNLKNGSVGLIEIMFWGNKHLIS
jgi:hypothetical protein